MAWGSSPRGSHTAQTLFPVVGSFRSSFRWGRRRRSWHPGKPLGPVKTWGSIQSALFCGRGTGGGWGPLDGCTWVSLQDCRCKPPDYSWKRRERRSLRLCKGLSTEVRLLGPSLVLWNKRTNASQYNNRIGILSQCAVYVPNECYHTSASTSFICGRQWLEGVLWNWSLWFKLWKAAWLYLSIMKKFREWSTIASC